MMAEAFICDAIRTPIGRLNGRLSAIRADDPRTGVNVGEDDLRAHLWCLWCTNSTPI
jgi:hypothetical protein